MPTVMVPSRRNVKVNVDDPSPPVSLHLPSLRATKIDESNKSHSIKEIIVDRSTNEFFSSKQTSSSNRFLPTAPTPRARGDGIHYFESDNENDFDDSDNNKNSNNNSNGKHSQKERKRPTMMDPPGFNENKGVVSVSKRQAKDPETASSMHRRRKRFIEEHARRITGRSSSDYNRKNKNNNHNNSGNRSTNIDSTERTVSTISEHSSWVPTRRMDKDPDNKPVYAPEMEPQMSRQTMEIRNRTIPQKPWHPDKELNTNNRKKKNRNNSNRHRTRKSSDDDEMDYSTTNEWVPSDFYRKQKPAQALHVSPTGITQYVSPYPPKQLPHYEHHHHQQQQQQQPQQQELRLQQQQQQQLQRQIQIQLQLQRQHELEAQHKQHQLQNVSKTEYRLHQLPKQPPSVIHTITTATTPSTPTPDNAGGSLVNTITTATTPASPIPDNIDPLKRKSMASDMDWSDIVISSTEEDTMMESSEFKVVKSKNRDSDESSTILEAFKNKFLSKRWSPEDSKAPTKDPEEDNTIQDSLISAVWKEKKKRWSDESKDRNQAEENSTVLDSYKRRKGKRPSDDSWNPIDNSLKKIINKEYSFDANDDGFDESLLSSSLTNLDLTGIPHRITLDQFVIPTIFVRKSGTSDLTFDVDATRQAIESTLTGSDEEITWSSTIHNSIISQEDVAVAAANAAAKELLLKESIVGSSKINNHHLSENGTAGLMGSATAGLMGSATAGLMGSATAGLTTDNEISLLGSGTSGFTGQKIDLPLLTESGVSDLTTSGVMGGKDASGIIIDNKFSALTDEVGARARRKMEDIPSEVSSYVTTLSQNRHDNSEASDCRSSWHHRTNICTTSTMVSTKKIANNKKNKFKPRRSSTSTLPSIGSIIPEEAWGNFEDDEEDDDDDMSGIYEIDRLDSDDDTSSSNSSGSDDDDDDEEYDIDELDLSRKLASIPEVAASRDMSKNSKNSREQFSRTNSRELSTGNSWDIDRDIESGSNVNGDRDNTSSNSNSRNRRTIWEGCVCLDIRCFDVGENGSRGKCNPTLGAYVVTFLFLFLVAVWTGIGIVWYRLRQAE